MAEEVMKKEDVDSLIESLPRDEYGHPLRLRNYKGFWYPQILVPTVISCRQRYRPRDTDVILASPPKCGTTWLKALAFATVNRNLYHPSCSPDHPLLSKHPQDCVPFIEWMFTDFSQLESVPPPRLLSTHMAYSLLPESTKTSSGCRMVFICRDPKDQLVSSWHFFVKEWMTREADTETVSLSGLLEMFCEGVSVGGPTWDHILEYWRASVERPSKMLFLHYEEMQRGPARSLRKLAEFLGFPFSEEEEEREGVPEDIVKLCSFENLSRLETNKGNDNLEVLGRLGPRKKSFFRKGKVGDWKNHLTTEMATKVDAIFQDKLAGTGLDLGGTESDSLCPK